MTLLHFYFNWISGHFRLTTIGCIRCSRIHRILWSILHCVLVVYVPMPDCHLYKVFIDLSSTNKQIILKKRVQMMCSVWVRTPGCRMVGVDRSTGLAPKLINVSMNCPPLSMLNTWLEREMNINLDQFRFFENLHFYCKLAKGGNSCYSTGAAIAQ